MISLNNQFKFFASNSGFSICFGAATADVIFIFGISFQNYCFFIGGCRLLVLAHILSCYWQRALEVTDIVFDFIGNGQAVTSSGCGRPSGVARVCAAAKTDADSPSSFIPYCSIGQTQLSFHGYMAAVKFFASVPGKQNDVFL